MDISMRVEMLENQILDLRCIMINLGEEMDTLDLSDKQVHARAAQISMLFWMYKSYIRQNKAAIRRLLDPS